MLLVGGKFLNAALTIYCSSKDDLKRSFSENFHFGRVGI